MIITTLGNARAAHRSPVALGDPNAAGGGRAPRRPQQAQADGRGLGHDLDREVV